MNKDISAGLTITCSPLSGLETLPVICFVEISERQTASAKPRNKNVNSMRAGYC